MVGKTCGNFMILAGNSSILDLTTLIPRGFKASSATKSVKYPLSSSKCRYFNFSGDPRCVGHRRRRGGGEHGLPPGQEGRQDRPPRATQVGSRLYSVNVNSTSQFQVSVHQADVGDDLAQRRHDEHPPGLGHGGRPRQVLQGVDEAGSRSIHVY